MEEKWLLLYFQSLTFFLKEKVTVSRGYSSFHRSEDGPGLELERCVSANPQNWGAGSELGAPPILALAIYPKEISQKRVKH